jgi:hypothetical protein
MILGARHPAALEAEAIFIIRVAVAEARNPVMLFSAGVPPDIKRIGQPVGENDLGGRLDRVEAAGTGRTHRHALRACRGWHWFGAGDPARGWAPTASARSQLIRGGV